MAPFASRMCGPKWFTRKFHFPSKDKEAESISIWEAFLTPRVFSLRINQSKIQVAFIAYQPNLVEQQFGLIQILPKPLYAKKNSLILYNAIHTEATSSRQVSRYVGQNNSLQLHSYPTSYVLMNSILGGAISTLKNFLMFLHLINTSPKLSPMCRRRSRKILRLTSNKSKHSKSTLKLPIDLMILVEPSVKQHSLWKKKSSKNGIFKTTFVR